MRAPITKCEDNLTLVIPDEAVAELGWGSGDIVEIGVSEGQLTATRVMTYHERAMQIARRVMIKYRRTFEALAKM